MANTMAAAPKRRSWLKIAGVAALILVALLVVMFFVVTSSGFIQGVILPKVGKGFGAEVTASDVSLSPFRQIVIRDLKVQAPGREALFTAKEIIVRYSLMDIVRGNYNIDLVSVASPAITLIERPDKTSNLDPIMEALGPEEEKESEPMNLDLKKLEITNGSLSVQKQPSDEGSYSSEITGLNFKIEGLKTGSIGKMTVEALMSMRSETPANPGQPAVSGSMSGAIKGAMDVGLTPMLLPSVLKGSVRMDVTSADGAFADMKGMAAVMESEVTPAEIRQFAVRLLHDQQTLAEVLASGSFDMEKIEGAIDIQLSKVNARTLELLSADSGLGFGKTSVGSTNRIEVRNAGQAVSARGAFFINDLSVTQSNQTTPTLSFQAFYDASVERNIAEIRRVMLKLAPTPTAGNEVLAAGRIDMSNPDFTSGNLKITADALDLTAYYRMFGAQSPATASAQQSSEPSKSSARPVPQTPQPETEAEPMALPLTNFVVDVAIKRLTMVELEITNFIAVTKINGGKVDVSPFEMQMNGAPVTSTIAMDLGVPGYKYDIAFGMTNVPFAPLVNTFVPDRKGEIGGTISANTRIKGAGTTDASLQKNLAGHFDIATTNLDLSISEMRSPILKTIVNVISVVPTIVKNPGAGLNSLAGALFGGGGSQSAAKPGGAWGEQLMKDPIDVIEGNAVIGGGSVKIERAFIQSLAFQAKAQGTVQLAKVLTNSSVNIPLNIAVRRSLAESINLVPPGTPTNAAYVALPDYVTVKGTIGEPKADIDKKALLGTVLQQYGGSIPGVDKQTGNLIQSLGGMLTGKKDTNAASVRSATNAPSSKTNSVATNDPVSGLLQGILGNRKK